MTGSDAITVLGAGNTGLSIAAKLALEGHDVLLWEAPTHSMAIQPLENRLQVRLTGVAGDGIATLAGITTDAGEALGHADVLVASVPSYAHEAFADSLIPHLESRHLLALLPGNLGTLAFAHRLRQQSHLLDSGLALVEGDTAPYVCRKLQPDHAHIWGVVESLAVGTMPATGTECAVSALRPFFPGIRAHSNALAAGLSALNPVVHPPGVLMNAGRIEYARGEFFFYEEGVTPGVVRVINALDLERRAIGTALGLDLVPVAESFSETGFGPAGDLWAVINGSRMLTQLKAPGSLETRWLAEDVPYGLRTWAELGARFEVPTPIMRALIALGDAVLQTDSWSDGRSLSDLGIRDMDHRQLEAYLRTGSSVRFTRDLAGPDHPDHSPEESI